MKNKLIILYCRIFSFLFLWEVILPKVYISVFSYVILAPFTPSSISHERQNWITTVNKSCWTSWGQNEMLRAIYHSQHFSQSAQREILTDFLPRTTRWGDGIRNNYFPIATKGKKRLLAFQYQVASLLVSITFKYFRRKKILFSRDPKWIRWSPRKSQSFDHRKDG